MLTFVKNDGTKIVDPENKEFIARIIADGWVIFEEPKQIEEKDIKYGKSRKSSN